MNVRLSKAVMLSICLLLCTGQPAAEASASGQFSIATGLGHYDSLTLDGKDQRFYLLPRWSWYQDRFYIENLDLGFNLYEDQQFSVDISTRQSFDALMFKGASANHAFLKGIALAEVSLPLPLPWGTDQAKYLGLQERRMSYLAGVSVFYRQNAWQFSSGLHQDVSNVHHGFEWSTEARYLYQQGDWSIALTPGLRNLSADYTRYYFGVDADQTLNTFSYSPGSAWLSSVRLELAYQVRPQQRVLLSVKREWLPNKLLQSYLLRSAQHDVWFVGYSWSW